MTGQTPQWLCPEPLIEVSQKATAEKIKSAIYCDTPDAVTMATLIAPIASEHIEEMASRAQSLTQKHFGRTISLYVPLYLSNYCPGGCAYCGFASDRKQSRHRLKEAELIAELTALKAQGFEDILLLTGERTPEADFNYLLSCVSIAAQHFHNVTIESFSMTNEEYKLLVNAGCTGVTLYQETYNPKLYKELHRWGPKQDFLFRLESTSRALEAGMRTAGVGALLGLDDPVRETIALFQHIKFLQKKFWRSGILVSFPRICAQEGGYTPAYTVSDQLLAQIIFAFRICLPDVPLVLSTREKAAFRDGMAGLGINRMSTASRTTVGGYSEINESGEQFSVSDTRDTKTFCAALKSKNLDPVFKNWDSVFTKLA